MLALFKILRRVLKDLSGSDTMKLVWICSGNVIFCSGARSGQHRKPLVTAVRDCLSRPKLQDRKLGSCLAFGQSQVAGGWYRVMT